MSEHEEEHDPVKFFSEQKIIDWMHDDLQRARDDNDRVNTGDAYRIALIACERTLRAVRKEAEAEALERAAKVAESEIWHPFVRDKIAAGIRALKREAGNE